MNLRHCRHQQEYDWTPNVRRVLRIYSFTRIHFSFPFVYPYSHEIAWIAKISYDGFCMRKDVTRQEFAWTVEKSRYMIHMLLIFRFSYFWFDSFKFTLWRKTKEIDKIRRNTKNFLRHPLMSMFYRSRDSTYNSPKITPISWLLNLHKLHWFNYK